jgi:hypothetical protein
MKFHVLSLYKLVIMFSINYANASVVFGLFFLGSNILYVVIYYLTYKVLGKKYGKTKLTKYPPYKIFNPTFIKNYPSASARNFYKKINLLTYSFLTVILLTFLFAIFFSGMDCYAGN